MAVPDTKAASALAALAAEKPATLMAQLRAVWPQVEKAIQMGHTLRVIHECLVQGGIPISYRRLTVYRGRIQRGKRPVGLSVRDTLNAAATQAPAELKSPAIQKTFDPLVGYRRYEAERERQNRAYPTGPPDESKLF